MKGLFIKDFSYIKQSKLMFVFLIIFGLGFSYFYDMTSFVYGYFSVFPSLLVIGTLNYDDSHQGMTALLSLPITKHEYVKQKYQLGLLLGFIFIVLSLVISLITQLKVKDPTYFSSQLFFGIVITLMIYYVILAVSIPTCIYFGSQRNQQAIFMIFGAILFVCFLIYFIFRCAGLDLGQVVDDIAQTTLPLVTILTVVGASFIYYLSYCISLKIIEDKEY